MKTIKGIAVVTLLLMSKLSFCDVIYIPPNSTYVGVCAEITNLSDYPSISLLGYYSWFHAPYGGGTNTFLVSADTCLPTVGSNCSSGLCAATKAYLSGKTIATLQCSTDGNIMKSNVMAIPSSGYLVNIPTVDSIKQYYKIMGFTDNTVVLFEWKEVTKFNNGKPDSTKSYTYTGDVTALSQLPFTASVILYPNPAQKTVHLKVNNSYLGDITVKMYATDGKLVKTSSVHKEATSLEFIMYIDTLKKGAYLVSITIGNDVESRKLLVN